MPLANTPDPPYYAVIFTSTRREAAEGYAAMAERMEALAATQPGFLGIESCGGEELAVAVSYWRTEADLLNWRRNLEHAEAQRRGKADWYSSYQVRVAKVERADRFDGRV